MENAQAIIEFIGKVVATSAVVLSLIWRFVNKMITDKVKEQIDAAMAKITQTTSKAVDDLRTELHKHAHDSDVKSEERAERITNRIDSLYELLSGRK